MNSELHTYLATALRAADQASNHLRENWGRQHHVQVKNSHHSIVTPRDQQSEAIILHTLHAAHPAHALLSEETGRSGDASDWVWAVDPLDGSSYYARGLDTFSVSVALLHFGHPVVGVVCCPIRGEVFSAVAGQGAHLNGQEIRCAKTPDLSQSLLTIGHGALRNDVLASQVRSLLRAVRSIRAGGSCAQDLCYIACGRSDAMVNLNQSIWDYAAGRLILQEAGGRLTGFANDPPPPASPDEHRFSFVASNGLIHDPIIAILSANPQPAAHGCQPARTPSP